MPKIIDNKQLIHIITEVTVILGVTLYFSHRIRKLSKQIQYLHNQIEEQNTKINRHEQLFSQIFSHQNPINISPRVQSQRIFSKQNPINISPSPSSSSSSPSPSPTPSHPKITRSILITPKIISQPAKPKIELVPIETTIKTSEAQNESIDQKINEKAEKIEAEIEAEIETELDNLDKQVDDDDDDLPDLTTKK